MPGPVLHVSATAMCPHGGTLNIIAASPRVLVSNMPAAVLTDQGLVAGCALNVSGKPQPCVTTRWIVGATRVTSGGVPLLIHPCVALCQSVEQIPGGPPIIASTQMRVIAT